MIGGPDGLMALYYQGGTSGLFDAIDVGGADDDLDVRFCEAVVAADPDYVEALAFLGNTYTRRGEHTKGLEIDLRLARLRPRSPRVQYNLACSCALTGRREEALAALRRAVEFGFTDADHMLKDDDLASLRDDPLFKTLVELVRDTEKDAKA